MAVSVVLATTLFVAARGLEYNAIPARVKASEQEYVEELRASVLENPQSALENPWDIRDASGILSIGNMGDIPIVTARSKASGGPMEPPGAVRAGGKAVQLASHSSGVLPQLIQNQWQRNKNGIILKWLRDEVKNTPNQVAIVIDSGDIISGGCTDKQLMEKYEAIVKVSGGAKLVASAEVSPYPVHLASKYKRADLENRRTKMLMDHNIKENWASKYADCRDHAAGPCDDPPKYQYLNMGFLMGPIEDLYNFYYHVFKAGGLDQLRATEYALDHPDKVTMDYGGRLALSLHNLAEDKQSPLSVSKTMFGKKKIIKNEVTGEAQCFVHGNGNGELFVKRLAEEMEA